jgi:hypothetical protein
VPRILFRPDGHIALIGLRHFAEYAGAPACHTVGELKVLSAIENYRYPAPRGRDSWVEMSVWLALLRNQWRAIHNISYDQSMVQFAGRELDQATERV